MSYRNRTTLYDINANKRDLKPFDNYTTSSDYSYAPPPSPRSPAYAVPPSFSATPTYVTPPQNEDVLESRQDVEYSRAPDMFPCGHVLCHNCVRKFMRIRQRSGYSRCPVCHRRVDEDAPLAAMGLPTNKPRLSSSSSSSSVYNGNSHDSLEHDESFSEPASPPPSEPGAISLLNNFDEIVKKFNGINNDLRRLKNESVQSKSMGMTYTNTQCHLCYEHHGTLRVVQEYNQLAVRHERPHAWSPYFYRLQQGKVVTEFYSQVNSSCICVPCTYKELQQSNLAELPNVNPQSNLQVCLAEVGKIVAKNSAPIMALQGKNVIEIDHTIRLRERADHFNFFDTAEQIERMVKQQETMLFGLASRQIRDTGRLYHMKESSSIEQDMDETEV